MTYEHFRLYRWVAVTFLICLSALLMAGLMGNTPVTWRVACYPNSPTCTTSAQSYSAGNTTCHCEKAP